MNLIFRLTVGAGISVLALFGLGAFAVIWSSTTQQGFLALPLYLNQYEELQRRYEELDARSAVVFYRIERRYWIADEVIAGRATLVDAAKEFQRISETLPYFFWDLFRAAYEGRSDFERHARYAMTYIELQARRDPALRATLLPRLQAELREIANNEAAAPSRGS